ncbi:hypothetical protein [Halobacterium jilantaiense]|uniref:Uncharacterized protein n=1 Tax=Halobacterium jilantaiense TaxID=355548 RepID=A0A1I0PUG7_9EURY|nr:hypothetical protein [Halobacterium jilantaiense]SEW18110.1 hypothetical protein SAMN04487945_1972 [Halobacterium jilantaiense]
MRKLRAASVALLVVASAGLVFGSMGFSSVAADRGVSVAVADDDNALVGYHTEDLEKVEDGRFTLVAVENQLASDANVTDVTVGTNDDAVEVNNVSEPFVGTGQTSKVRADVDCQPGGSATLTVSVTVEAEGVTAEISGDTATRTFDVTCEDMESRDSDVRFDGWGNVHFDGWNQEALNVTYWVKSKGGFDRDTVEVGHSETLKHAISGKDTKFVAVYVEATNRTYFNSKFEDAPDEHSVDGKQGPGDD